VPPPTLAFSPITPPGLTLPRLNCIRGEKRGRERKRKEEKKEAVKREKGRKRRKKRKKKIKGNGKKKYLFVENMISKLYCLLLFGKENKK
jgi:hypothetical protein